MGVMLSFYAIMVVDIFLMLYYTLYTSNGRRVVDMLCCQTAPIYFYGSIVYYMILGRSIHVCLVDLITNIAQ